MRPRLIRFASTQMAFAGPVASMLAINSRRISVVEWLPAHQMAPTLTNEHSLYARLVAKT